MSIQPSPEAVKITARSCRPLARDRQTVHGHEAMAQRKSILIIDDDQDLREALSEQLELHQEFTPLTAADAGSGIAAARTARPDLILLDVDLPDMNGREAIRLLRASGIMSPVIMLTAAAGEADTILGLDSGAGDYVTKPFKFNVLLARIRAQLRNHEQSEDAVFRIGPYQFHPAAKLLVDDRGAKLRLTEKEANILKYLYRAAKPVSREELLAEVWGYNAAVTTHTLETHVYRLRQKIEPDPALARLLITEAGGYRLAP
jgi:DNA-binding response OmpR family regulator